MQFTQCRCFLRSIFAVMTVLCLGVRTFSAADDQLVVEYKCAGTNPNENQIRAHFQIANHGTQAVPLAELTMRYWYVSGGTQSQNYWCDWAKIGAANINATFHKLDKPVAGADTYLEIGFIDNAGTVQPGDSTGEIQIRVAKQDWSNFDQSQDYSFDPGKTAFAEWPQVSLHRRGQLIWGKVPGGASAKATNEKPSSSGSGKRPKLSEALSRDSAPPLPLPQTPAGGMPANKNLYMNRFLALWGDLHNPANGYFSPEGVPYHSIETLMVEAPDYGHETTSEAFSYWLWLEAAYGKATGDWEPLQQAWQTMERQAIPSQADQPTNSSYNVARPAAYAAEHNRIEDYPSPLDTSIPVGQDPIAQDLRSTYGTGLVYGMHWLLDVDNWYGYGRRGDGQGRPSFINTFQRGPTESVWKTIPQPCWDAFRHGGRNGFLDLFIRDGNYTRQWRYTNAPDADARAVQAIYWAHVWAAKQSHGKVIPVEKAVWMGDFLRYAMFDKYFKKLGCRSPREPGGTGYQSAHYLMSWYYAWGGAVDPSAGWAWRIGCSHVHFGYQNPLTAWILSTQPDFRPASANGARDWDTSLKRQLEFYRWLQSAEGGIAGGATNSWNGSYDVPPAGTPTFYGMSYDWQPVYHDPPSNDWFGMQVWSMERLAEYYHETGDKQAKAVLDKWIVWAMAGTRLTGRGYSVPAKLQWKGQPDTWNPERPGDNAGLHVTVVEWNQDVGVAASLAKALIFYSAGTKRWAVQHTESLAMARELLDRMWLLCRDGKGVSTPEPREDYKQLFETKIHVPAGWTGKMANGDPIVDNVTFLELRSKYRNDPDFARVEDACRNGKAPVFRYHRFWAQCEVATANAIAAIIGGLGR